MIAIICDVCGKEQNLIDINPTTERPLYFDFYAIPDGGGPGVFSLAEDDVNSLPLQECRICFCRKCAGILQRGVYK